MGLSTPINIKSGDSRPAISHVFESALDLGGATAVFHMADLDMVTVLESGAVTISGESPNWVLKHTFSASQTDPLSGLYHGEFRVTLADNSVISEPNDGYLLIKVQGELGPASGQTTTPTSVLASSSTVLASSSTVLASSG